MAKLMSDFEELAKQVDAESETFKWEDMTQKQQELSIMMAMKVYYEKHPDEAKEILEGDE